MTPLVLLLVLYLLPCLIAGMRTHRHRLQIGLALLLLAWWCPGGWVVVLIWATWPGLGQPGPRRGGSPSTPSLASTPRDATDPILAYLATREGQPLPPAWVRRGRTV